jgi:hypothetical protein
MVLALALVVAPGAVAATEVGDECVGNVAGEPFTLVPEAHVPSGPLPLAVPSNGVVTAWKVRSEYPGQVPEVMAAFRSVDTGKFEVVGESTEQKAGPGLNVFPTRIPVQAGDRLGLMPVGSEKSPLICETTETGDHTWSLRGSVGLGSAHQFAAGVFVRVPLVSVIEPDKDGDGYGDETQDKCPQSAAYQGPCPTISLDTFPIVLKRSVLVLVSASESSSVQVFGQVGWRPRHKGGALASKTPKKPGDQVSTGVIVGLSGGTTLVKPGETTPYNVKLPKSVLRHLSQIAPKQVVKGTITARTTDLAGRTVDHTITIRLHGRGPAGSAGVS